MLLNKSDILKAFLLLMNLILAVFVVKTSWFPKRRKIIVSAEVKLTACHGVHVYSEETS